MEKAAEGTVASCLKPGLPCSVVKAKLPYGHEDGKYLVSDIYYFHGTPWSTIPHKDPDSRNLHVGKLRLCLQVNTAVSS